jgi:hypothetical protein
MTVLRGFLKLEEWHISGIPTVHGLATNLTLGITPLLERQPSRRHLIFRPAIGTFENDHRFTVRPGLMV